MKILMLSMSSLLLAAFAVAGSSGSFPFTGLVTGNNVNVRSGPDTNWYAVAKLMQDNRVQVIGEDSGWYQIVPPQGTFSLVSQDYVDKSGNKGTITGDKVAIRAGSSLSDQDNAIQLLAGKGTEVTIVGQQGTWYKIVPPDGAYVWVAKQFVKPADAAVKAQPAKEEAVKGSEEAIAPPDEVEGGSITTEETPTTQKAVVGAETGQAGKSTLGGKLTTRAAVEPQIPGLVRTSKTTIRTQGVPGETKETTITSTTVKGDGKSMGEYGDKLYEIEKAFIEELKKPLKDRNLAPLIAKLEPIANQKENEAAATFAKNRIEAIKYQMEGQEGVTKLQAIQQEYTTSVNSVQMPAMKDYKESEISAAPFQGAGVLRPSLVFSGPLMPERYRLFDTEKNRTVAYVDIAPEVQIHISDYIGKNVAVYGKATVDEKLGYRVIHASFFKIVPEPESVTNSSQVIP
jgi:uncharacterized protein YgiM (DUF1202 family)